MFMVNGLRLIYTDWSLHVDNNKFGASVGLVLGPGTPDSPVTTIPEAVFAITGGTLNPRR